MRPVLGDALLREINTNEYNRREVRYRLYPEPSVNTKEEKKKMEAIVSTTKSIDDSVAFVPPHHRSGITVKFSLTTTYVRMDGKTD